MLLLAIEFPVKIGGEGLAVEKSCYVVFTHFHFNRFGGKVLPGFVNKNKNLPYPCPLVIPKMHSTVLYLNAFARTMKHI